MTISLPSKRVAIVDAPEVENFSAKFIYKFFTIDEELNDSGTTPPDFIEKRAAERFDTNFLDSRNFNRFTPRYVRFEWRPNPAGNRPDMARTISIASNISKIHSEETFITDNFTNVFFQDQGQDDRISYFIRRAIEEAKDDLDGDSETYDGSPLDLSKYLHRNTTSAVTGDFLAKHFTGLRRSGVKFLDDSAQSQITQTVLQRVKNVRTRTQLNNKLLATMLKTTKENVVNIFDTEMAALLPQAENIQQRAIAQEAASTLSADEYDFEIVDIVDYRTIDPGSFDSTVQVVGYIIDKTEYTDNGPISRAPIIVESPRAGSTADLKIKYGAKYGYTVRSIVLVEVSAQDEDTNNVIAVTFLVASKNSPEIVVDCSEAVPPPSVADLSIDWDFDKDKPRLLWAFPNNPQRDIKYFQIFKRTSIEEPFTLLKMYDFNDSQTPANSNEDVDPILIEKMSSPKNYYIDYDFNREESAIYAICTVDAHGFSSNFSIQFEVRFDRFGNKLVKKLVSLAGAPKPYPNFYLQRDAFVDTIRSSGAKLLRVVFNPEYTKLVDKDKNDLRLIRTDPGSKYTLQLLNVDLQQQSTVSIQIDDRRSKTDKP